jgi:hypothetical protein
MVRGARHFERLLGGLEDEGVQGPGGLDGGDVRACEFLGRNLPGPEGVEGLA